MPSVTLTATVGLAGPSGKVQLERAARNGRAYPTSVPPVPHVGKPDAKLSVSPSASEVVNV